MAQVRKYATLPDIDTAPDIYESLVVLDEVGLPGVPASELRDPSPERNSHHDNTVVPIDQEHIRPDRARNQFRNSRVDVKNADFSGRIGSNHKSYRVTQSGKLRSDRLVASTYEEFSDEENESLSSKITRLRRELEEVRSELADRTSSSIESGPVTDIDDSMVDNKSFSKLSESIKLIEKQWLASRTMNGPKQLSTSQKLAEQSFELREAKVDGLQTNLSSESCLNEDFTQAVKSLSDIDKRMSALEQLLGMQDSWTQGTVLQKSHNRSIMLSLTILENRLQALVDAKVPNMEELSHQIQQVNQEIQGLREACATGNRAESTDTGKNLHAFDQNENSQPSGLTQAPIGYWEQAGRINKIYNLMSSLELMSPLLPGVVERLRALKILHADASEAVRTLRELEREQSYASDQIRKWGESLSQLEAVFSENIETMRGNVREAETWVKQLEDRGEQGH